MIEACLAPIVGREDAHDTTVYDLGTVELQGTARPALFTANSQPDVENDNDDDDGGGEQAWVDSQIDGDEEVRASGKFPYHGLSMVRANYAKDGPITRSADKVHTQTVISWIDATFGGRTSSDRLLRVQEAAKAARAQAKRRNQLEPDTLCEYMEK